MAGLIAAAMGRARSIGLILLMLLISGSYAYFTMAKEAAPEIYIPLFTVSVSYPGISAQDSARLLVEPLERKFQSLKGLRKMTARAGEGFASLLLEFDPGFDQQRALQSVRDETDNATADLPSGVERPIIREIDISLFPILTLTLSGEVAERELTRIARELEQQLETLNGVLEADISGIRDEVVEIVLDPLALQSYGISPQEIQRAISNNNQLITAGNIDNGAGRIGLSVPGRIETIKDIEQMPVKVIEQRVVRVKDVAQVRQTYQDADSLARVNNRPTIAIDIRKTSGANIIDTVAEVKALIETQRAQWPAQLQVDYLQDQADTIQTLLNDLQNNVIAAVLLVALTMLIALGFSAALLVSVAIPGAFLGGVLLLHLMGYTLNIVVLFGLILVIGMLVDGAIVVVERAERLQDEGHPAPSAFLLAAQQMAWPIIASTATTIAVFFPLLFWPGTAGQFMFYLPATVIFALSVSLFMALIFVPVIGAALSPLRPRRHPQTHSGVLSLSYTRLLTYLIQRPGLALGLSLLALIVSFILYSQYGRGINFFPQIEPEHAQIQIRADGNLSLQEADRIVRLVEQRILNLDGIEHLYARSIASVEQRLNANLAPDIIGTIQLDLADWQQRDKAQQILQRIRQLTADLPGIGLQIEQQQSGPAESRPIQLQVAAAEHAVLQKNAEKIQQLMQRQPGLIDVANDAPRAQVEIRLRVNRELAARYGIDISNLGKAVQLLTNGVLIGTYLPDFAREEIDIRLRFPSHERTFAQLADLRIASADGMIPISNFVHIEAAPNYPLISRVDARNVHTLSANIRPDTTASAELAQLREKLPTFALDREVELRFAGEQQDLDEAARFLIAAFFIALFLMILILLTQFNSFFQTALVLSAIIFSIAGVLVGLIIRQEAFSIVMSGIGIMALAGIVVNNNIILIDAYNSKIKQGRSPNQAALEAGSERLRPVILTSLTTLIGLLPMVFGLTLDFFARDILLGAPSGQFWIQLATSIVGGLTLATLITLLLTPALLAWDGRRRIKTPRQTAQRVIT